MSPDYTVTYRHLLFVCAREKQRDRQTERDRQAETDRHQTDRHQTDRQAD